MVAEACDVESTVHQLREHRPDVLILDLNMPGGRTPGAVPQMLDASPQTGVVVLTMETDQAYAREAIQAGLIAFGHTNTEIAEQLFLSVRTVESHRAHVQQKLQLSKRSELVRYALDRGLLSEA